MSAPVAESKESSEDSEPGVVLVEPGRTAAIVEHAVFREPLEREAVSARRKSLRRMYAALMRSEESLGSGELLSLYVSAKQAMPDRGWYGELQDRRWWREVGRENLLRLPGVELASGDDDRLRFVGIDPEDIESEHTRPLEAFRSDPRVETIDHLVWTHGPSSEAYEQVLRLWDAVVRAGETTMEELGRDYRLEPERFGDELAECPHIERTVETFDPDEIPLSEVETVGDMLSMAQARSSDETIRWEYTGPAPSSDSEESG